MRASGRERAWRKARLPTFEMSTLALDSYCGGLRTWRKARLLTFEMSTVVMHSYCGVLRTWRKARLPTFEMSTVAFETVSSCTTSLSSLVLRLVNLTPGKRPCSGVLPVSDDVRVTTVVPVMFGKPLLHTVLTFDHAQVQK